MKRFPLKRILAQIGLQITARMIVEWILRHW